MASQCPLKSLEVTASSPIVKIQKMISDNYSMLGLYIVLAFACGVILWYFVKDFFKLISRYLSNKSAATTTTIANSSYTLDKNADDVVYDNDLDPIPQDVQKYMDTSKKTFVKEVEKVYQPYNDALADYITSMGKTENDNKVDSSILYKTHDDFSYKN